LDPRNKTVILGWINSSPVWDEYLSSLSIDTNGLYENLLKENFLWVDKSVETPFILEYLINNENFKGKVQKLDSVGQDYSFYRFKPNTQ